MTRQIVNQQRRASANINLVHQPTLQLRAARPRTARGPSNPTPGLLALTPTMNRAVFVTDDGIHMIRVKSKVYPPVEVSEYSVNLDMSNTSLILSLESTV